MRCSRDALTVDPSDGAISGRRPANVPTTSDTSQVDVHRGVDRVEQPVDLPAGRGRSGGGTLERRVGRADQPVIGPRDEEDDLARHPDGEARLVRDAIARHDEVRSTAGQDPHRAAGERVSRFGGPHPGRVNDRRGRDLEVAVGRQVDRLKRRDPSLTQTAAFP